MRPHVGASVVMTRRGPWRGALVVERGDPDPRARLTNSIRIVRLSRILGLLNPFAT